MYAVNVTIKVQNELAKKAIILALKDWSNDLFQNNGLMLRCFVDRTENQVEIFHVFRTKKEMEEVRTTKSNKFYNMKLMDILSDELQITEIQDTTYITMESKCL